MDQKTLQDQCSGKTPSTSIANTEPEMLLLPVKTTFVAVRTEGTQREPAHWSRVLIELAVVLVVVATISFLLRLYSRRKTTWKPAIEDVFMGIGILFSYLLSACVIIAALNGVGYNIWALPRQTQGRVSLVFWLGQKFWVLAHVFVKISITFLIRRLLSIVGPWQKVTTGLIVFTIAWGITNIVGNALQCIPPRYFWMRDIDGKCNDNQEAFAITMGSLALAQDAILLVIPIVIVWRMKLVRPEKIRITALFAFGGLVCIFGILRVVELVHYQQDNLTASGCFEVTWALLELNLGIVCACVVLMRPLLHSCKAFIGRCWSQGKKSLGSRSSTRVDVMNSKDFSAETSASQQSESVD